MSVLIMFYVAISGLHITLSAREADTYYVVTARVADHKERAYYQKHKDEQEVSI